MTMKIQGFLFTKVTTIVVPALALLLLTTTLVPALAYAGRLADARAGRVVQVNLAEHPKVSQYTDINSSASGYGKNACGLVAAAGAVAPDNLKEGVELIARAAGTTYSPSMGIQP